MNLKDIHELKVTEADLATLLDNSSMDADSLRDLPFSFSEDPDDGVIGRHHVWIPECHYIGNLCTNDLEGAGEETLLVSVLLRLLAAGRIRVTPEQGAVAEMD